VEVDVVNPTGSAMDVRIAPAVRTSLGFDMVN
jgi:hypothetical protein